MTSAMAMYEEEVEAFLTKLKNADADKKVDVVQCFGLKLEESSELPESSFDAITLLIAPLLRSTSHLLVTSVLTSFLPIYLPVLPITPPTHLRLASHHFLPPLLDKLNDPKERTHTAASSNIAVLGRKCYEAESTPMVGKGKDKETLAGMWERMVKEGQSKGWRGKVEGMKMLLVLRAEKGSRLPLKPWLGTLVDLLEDGDGNVRDQARETVIALLSPSSTPAAARSELKKLLLARNVRKTIADAIINRIFSANGNGAVATSATEFALPEEDGLIGLVEGRAGAMTPAQEDVEVVYIASGRDLESEFAKMVPYFADKETEHNWAQREKSVVRIRGMLRGQAHQQYPEAFTAGLKAGIMDGIAKTLMSLRTTVSQQSCAVIQELAERMGSAFDPFVENLLPVLGKMGGFTKKIIAEKSQRSLSAIIIHTTCHPRMLINHITSGVGYKNIQTRHHCTSHLKTYLDVHGIRSRHTIETTAGLLDAIEKAINRALVDVNPAVRDLGRAAFWSLQAVWPQRAATIMNELDGVARKQLEKANPHDSNDVVIPATARPSAPKKAGSAMSLLLAEKRKAKAAELAAGRIGEDSARTVSSPMPDSPSLQSGIPRSTCSTSVSAARQTAPIKGSAASTQASPGSPRQTPLPKWTQPSSSPQDFLQRSHSSNLGRTPSTSPSSSRSSVTSRNSPLRQTSTLPSGIRSPASSSGTSGPNTLRTPTLFRKPLPSFNGEPPVGIGIYASPEAAAAVRTDKSRTSARDSRSVVGSAYGIVEDALHAQAAQAVSAAQQLLEFAEDDTIPSGSMTPLRPTKAANGNLLKTPVNGNGFSRPWEESPRSQAMTPMMLDKLRERKHERSWWLKRQQLLDKATPLKSSTPTAAASVVQDVEALASGQPKIRNLQKLALFSTSHPISLRSDADEEDIADEKRVWGDERLFERVFEGLMGFLVPSKPTDALEHALVLLWEMIQHQWIMFEDRYIQLCEALFLLRASRSSIILESTNSLISLLAEASDSLFFLGVLRDALAGYLEAVPTSTKEDLPTSCSTTNRNTSSEVVTGERARASGYLFGLNAMGICMLKLPKEVVEVEGRRLAPVITEAMASPTSTTRQAANTLILAIQCVLADSQATLAMFPQLNRGQKDLAMYLMERNGLLGKDDDRDKEVKQEKVMGEVVGLMARGVRDQPGEMAR